MIANFFWDVQELTKLERLCILSFAKFFKTVRIFTYNPILFNKYRSVVDVINANEILDESHKFYYNGVGDCPKKSVVGFSDIFRYQLLYNMGGWYFDMDCICLKDFAPLDARGDIITRSHLKHLCVSNMCKFPKGHPILRELYETTVNQVHASNSTWNLPLEIFQSILTNHSLLNTVASTSELGNDDYKRDIKPLLYDKVYKLDLSERYAVHLCASAVKTGNWSSSHFYDVETPLPGTLLSYLYNLYSIT